jgi:CRP-like cAMP-binding protein
MVIGQTTEPLPLTLDERVAALEKFPVFKGLGAPARRALASLMREERAPAGAVLVRPGERLDRVWFVLAGWIEASFAGVAVVQFAPGESMGDVPFFTEDVAGVTSTAIEPLTALTLGYEDFGAAIERAPKLAQSFMRRYAGIVRLGNLVRYLNLVPARLSAPLPVEGDRAAILRALPLFSGVDDPVFLRRLAANVQEVSFAPGEEICRHGAPNDAMFLCVAGEAEARRGDVAVGTNLPGDSFGELGLLDGEAYAASLFAVSACRFLTLGRAQLFAALNQSPRMALNLVRAMAWRQRLSTLELAREMAASDDAPRGEAPAFRQGTRLPYLDVPEHAWVEDSLHRWRMPTSGDLTRRVAELTEAAAAADPARHAPDADDFKRALAEEQAAVERALHQRGCPAGVVGLAADLYARMRSTVHPKKGHDAAAGAIAAAALSGRPLPLRAVLASPTAVAELPSFLRFAELFRARGVAVELRALLVRWENLEEVRDVPPEVRDETFRAQVAAVRDALEAAGFPRDAVDPADVAVAMETGAVEAPADAAAAFDEIARAAADLSAVDPAVARDLVWITGFYDRQASLKRLGPRQPPLDLTLRRCVGKRIMDEARALGGASGPPPLMLTSELHKRFLPCYSASVPILNIALG